MKRPVYAGLIVSALVLSACSETSQPSAVPAGKAGSVTTSPDKAPSCAALDACVAAMLAAADPLDKAGLAQAEGNLKKLNKAVKGDAKLARQLYEQSVAESKKGNRPAALQLFRQAAEADPTDPEILDSLAFLTIQANDLGGAAKIIHAGLAVDPRYAELWGSLSLMLTGSGRKDDAVRALLLDYYFEKDGKTALAQWEKNLASMNDDSRFVFAAAIRKIKDAERGK